MTTSAPDNRLYVVVGLIKDSEGKLFIQQRRPGAPKAGKWEFPGGKREQGETPQQALSRELQEELGIIVLSSKPLTVVTHDYQHANVWLDTYLITEFDRTPIGREGQTISWVDVDDPADLEKYDFLAAVFPILEAYKSTAID